MRSVNKSEVSEIVLSLHEKGRNWHYHLLTPTCQFNRSGKYAILVENVDTKEVFAYYSDKAEMELSNTFSELLHGKEVMNQRNTKANYSPSKDVRAILNLIKELSKQSVVWHHHVFFPGCTFNSHVSEFELVVEDPRSTNRLVSISDTEPKEDLKQIESIFYAQDM